MESIKNLCENSFHDVGRSKANTFAGFVDHVARLTKADFSTGPLTATLKLVQTESATLAEEVRTAQVAVGTNQAQQQSGRATTDADRRKAIARIKDNAAALDNSYFIADAAERQRLRTLLYPGGLEPLTRASLRDLPTLLATYMATVAAEQKALGQTFFDQTMTDLAPFTTTREIQIGQKASTSKARDARQDLVARVEEQLTYNYHLLSAYHRGNWGIVTTYYDPRYFDGQTAGREGQRRGRAAVAEQKTVLDLAAADPAFTHVTLVVDEGPGPLEFARAASAAIPPGAWLPVTFGAPQRVALADLPGTGPLLVVRNPTDKAGHYRVALGK